MKRKLRIGLTTELIILIWVAIIITFIIIWAVEIGNSNGFDYIMGKIISPQNFKDEIIIKKYKNDFHPTINNIINENKNVIKIPHKLDRKLEKAFNNRTDFVCIFNSNGEILHSNKNDNIYNIKKEKIRENLEVRKVKSSVEANIKEIKKIDNNLYILVLSHRIAQTGLLSMIVTIFIWIVIFAILTKGRLKYIIGIKKGVDKLYLSDFQDKVPLKYNNELTSLATALNDMGDKIRENKKNEEEFLLNISHDLRTPLTSILGFLSLLKEKKYDTEKERDRYINTIEEQSIYLKTLIEEFFQFSKLKWKHTKLQRENIKLQEILRQIVDGFYPQLKENSITIDMNFPEKPVYTDVDIDKFMRVLENLISNAIKYSSAGTDIIINLYKNKDKIIMEFWNTPKDVIKEDELKFLFKRFYKKDLSRGSKGAGLGLAIALEAVKLHGGQLYAVIKNEKLGMIMEI